MDFKKALLKAASIFALTAGGQYAAQASIPPDDGMSQKTTLASSAQEDPIFALLSRTDGTFSGESIEPALREVFHAPDTAQLEAIPALLQNLSRLGAPSDVVARARDVLIELVSSSSNISDDVAETVLSQLRQPRSRSLSGTFKLAAQVQHKPIKPGLVIRPPKQREKGEMGGGGQAPQSSSSDVRLKHDISLIDRLDNGLGLYRFSYIGSEKAYVGVMAQEVEAIMPEAVECDSDGYLCVRYDMLGIHMQSWEEWMASRQPKH
jgi:hypothetical protein